MTSPGVLIIPSPVEHIQIHRVTGRELDGSDYAGFVFSTFTKSLRLPVQQLCRLIDRSGVNVLIASPRGEPDTYVGWIAVLPSQNRIIAAYTSFVYRATPEQRQGLPNAEDGFRIASSLAIGGGINFERPVLCSVWSRAARKIAGKHNPYNLVYAPEAR